MTFVGRAFQAQCVGVALLLIAGCSSGPSGVPKPVSAQGGEQSTFGNPRAGLRMVGLVKEHRSRPRHIKGYYACPATGSIKYVSDEFFGIIDVFAGKFEGQRPCAVITNAPLLLPIGLYVRVENHDLYVANGVNVLVYHRGKTTPYNMYVDPANQYVFDVTVANDGTVIVSNTYRQDLKEEGSLSTWISGPNGGTFIGNFPMTNDRQGYWVTVRNNGTVYYDDLDATSGIGALWSLKCPSGVCGPQTQARGVSFAFPGGMSVDATGDLRVIDQNGWTADTFELPNPSPSTFPIYSPAGGMAINKLDNHLFVPDTVNATVDEYSYPRGKLVGTVPGNCPRSLRFHRIVVRHAAA